MDYHDCMGTHQADRATPLAPKDASSNAPAKLGYSQVVFDTMPSGVVVQDPDGKIIAVNAAAERILGLSQDQMRGLTSIDPGWRALHEDGSDFPGQTHPAMQALRSGEQVSDVVMGIYNPQSGSHSWINVQATPVRGAEGELQAVYSFFEDITARKRLEVRAQEYSMAIQTSSDGFWVVDMQGQLLEANLAYTQASGYSRSELLDMHVYDLDCFDKSQAVQTRLERIMQTGHERFVTAHRTRDGRSWPVEMVVSYAPLQGGRLFCFVRDLSEQQLSADLIWHQANFDRLTDLPNRALFFDRLSQECAAARRSGKRVALLFADLDAFKPVNDQFGHAAGDVALQTVAARWQACVRGNDTIARLGGDEFAVIVGQLDSAAEAATIADKLIQALARDMALPEGKSCRLGVSIGISIFPDNALEMDSLLSLADDTMYHCKARGKNAYAFSEAQARPSAGSDPWIHFQDAHLVGVAEIDAQHRQLVRMVNEINMDISAGTGDAHIARRLEELLKFTHLHFQTEHRYMQAHQYPDTRAHDLEHGKLSNDLQQTVERAGRDGDLLVLQKIKDWLMNHIEQSDRALGLYLQSQGVR